MANPGKPWSMDTCDAKLKTADELWLEKGPDQAAPLYGEMLENLPAAYEPFRPLVIMRLAYARFKSDDKTGCLQALDRLKTFEYVPEHHALAAKELRAVVSGQPDPATQNTPVPPLSQAAATIHVDAEAGPGGDGSSQRPVRTLSQAVELSRKIEKKVENRAIHIVLAPGVYIEKQTVKLSPDDKSLVIRSADPDNPATLSGRTVLLKWDKVTDKAVLAQLPDAVRDRVLVCNLGDHGVQSMGDLVFGGFSSGRVGKPNNRFKSFAVPELFYKGRPQTMARWPNHGLTRLPVNEKPQTHDPRYQKWAKEQNLWLYGYWDWDWADAYEKVASIDASGTITLEPPVNRYGFRKKLGCAINALCELDWPGEWYLDTKNNRVYFLPPEKFEPGKCILSSFGTILSAEDCPGLQIRDMVIDYVRGDALMFKNCSDLLLSGIEIRRCSGNGINIYGGKRHLVHSCAIESMGRGGIDILAGDWRKLDPSGSVIENCRISDLSRIDRTYTPAIVLEGMGLKVRRNAFVNIPSSAIRLEACDALVELNYFHRCVYESGDQGAIDQWANPLYRGNVFRRNYFHGIVNETGAHHGAAAVRLDDFISGFMIAENIFHTGALARSSGHEFGSVQINKGTDNYLEGNIIIDWHKAFTGTSETGDAWRKKITGHSHSKKMLAGTPWQSEAWQAKYPMVRDLLNGNDNRNYIADNRQFGSGEWGEIRHAVMYANRDKGRKVPQASLEALQPLVVPWHPIPVNMIGPYDLDSLDNISRYPDAAPVPIRWLDSADLASLHNVNVSGEGNITHCDNNDWIAFGPYDFSGKNIVGIEISAGVHPEYANQKIHLRLDSPASKPMATLVMKSTGGWHTFETHRAKFESVTGAHKVYIVFEGKSGVCNFGKMRFSTRGTLRHEER